MSWVENVFKFKVVLLRDLSLVRDVYFISELCVSCEFDTVRYSVYYCLQETRLENGASEDIARMVCRIMA